MPNTGDIALKFSLLLVDSLVRGGMRHACVSPGSRSTPITLALDRHPSVDVHVHLDERSSAFVALGVAKSTGAPVAVACTSGTAAAEFFPAVVEASQSELPLILLTADRPPRLRGTAANQTIDQEDLYGRYVRRFLDAPIAAPGQEWSWLDLGKAAVSAAVGSERFSPTFEPAGPVHVNLPFEEPLTPSGRTSHRAEEGPPPARESVDAWLHAAEQLSDTLMGFRGKRGVVLAGGAHYTPDRGMFAAPLYGWPVVAEPTSGQRRGSFTLPSVMDPSGTLFRTPGPHDHPTGALSAGQALIASEPLLRALEPEIVIQLDAPPTSRAGQALLRRAPTRVVIAQHHLDPDPEGVADLRFDVGGQDFLTVAAQDIDQPDPSSWPWYASWFVADWVARRTIDSLYDSWDEPYEGRIARDLARWIPNGSTLFVGSSMPIRDLDYSMDRREGLRVLANRGASGIDGLVATAMGIAEVEPDRPTFALLGDLSLLHDGGSLLWNGRRKNRALVIVVPNNDGGGIFSFLDQRGLPEHTRLFTTPHGIEIGGFIRSCGAGHQKVDRAKDLVPALVSAVDAGGVQVVEVTVDRESSVDRHQTVQATVDEELADFVDALENFR